MTDKEQTSGRLLPEQKSKLNGRRVVASVSGGKDSAALSLHLAELGIEHDRVFLDTGWEHPDTYAYLRGPLTEKLGPIIEIRSEKYPGGMVDLVTRKGMFPSRTRRFCTQALKVEPMQAYIRGRVADGAELVNAVGIRRGESEARSRMAEWEWSEGFDCEVWRPLVDWTEDDVIAIHARHQLAPNPLYLRGASRVGCYPCIFARKSEIDRIARLDPQIIDKIEALESVVADAAEARQAAKGTTLEAQGYMRPTFFQAMGALRSEGKDGRMVPIREVVTWASTGAGGRQFEMFAAGERDAGCMRWGLCETNPERSDG